MIPEKYRANDERRLENRDEVKKQIGYNCLFQDIIIKKTKLFSLLMRQVIPYNSHNYAAENTEAEFIVFCGVHFMAETADILTTDKQKVSCLICVQVVRWLIWRIFIKQKKHGRMLQNLFGDTILPLTYVNSTAAIKSFIGANGGARSLHPMQKRW